jgi:hypothetical protein
VGSLLFVVHPVHVESVAWISGSTDLLLTFFFSAAFLSYLRYKKKLDYRLFVMTVVFFVGALLSKEPAVVFPVLVLAWDLIQEKKVHVKQLVILCAITAVYFIVRAIVLGRPAGMIHLSPAGFAKLAGFAALYIKLLVVPWPLSLYLKAPSITVMDILISSVIFVMILLAAMKERRTLFFLVWFFLTLAPSLSLAFRTNPTFAERFAYLPSLGFIVALICILQSVKVNRKVLLGGLSVVIAIIQYSALWQRETGEMMRHCMQRS